MKALFILTLAVFSLALITSSCAQLMSPDEKAQYDKLIAAETEAKAALTVAQEHGDPVEIATAQATVEAAEMEIGRLEVAVNRRIQGPFWSMLNEVPVVGGIAKLLGPFAGSLILPLFGKRSRKHYWQLVKDLTPWVPDEAGQKGVDVTAAVSSARKMLGWEHSATAA